jgi:hypothetical protein
VHSEVQPDEGVQVSSRNATLHGSERAAKPSTLDLCHALRRQPGGQRLEALAQLEDLVDVSLAKTEDAGSTSGLGLDPALRFQ